MTMMQDRERAIDRAAADPVIRAVLERDHYAVHDLLTSEWVVEGTMRLPFARLADTVERLSPRPGVHQLVAELDGELAGFLELVTFPGEARHRHAGEVNLVCTHAQFARRGVGRSLMTAALQLADDWLGLERVGLVVFVDNPGARALYEQLGFELEGTLRNYAVKRGEHVDANVMSRLRHS